MPQRLSTKLIESTDEKLPIQDAVHQILPVPSDDPQDPLNWSVSLKASALIQVSLLAALGGINTAIINPAYVPISEELDISTITVSYQTTIVLILNGVGPWIWVPLANRYGRRPILIGTTALGFASALGAGYARTWAQLIGARVVNGFFPAAFSIGPAVVMDLFFFHQRGRAMGIFTVTTVNGSHIAPLLGGPLGQFLGWRWCFKFAAILNGVMLLIILLGFPETLYDRPERDSFVAFPRPRQPFRTIMLSRLKLPQHYPQRKLHSKQFVYPSIRMARYPSVIFPALYFAAQYGFASILPAVTVASIFHSKFEWDTLQIGLGYGAALTIGGSLGELAAGMVLDAIVKRRIKRFDGEVPEPEARLQAIWTGEILVPTGLLIYGFTLQYKTHWIAPLVGMGISAFAIQVITTTTYTYAIECYREQGSDVAQLFNLLRQVFGFTFAFYAVKLCEEIGYQFTFLMFALLGSGLAFVPIVGLMFRGGQVREKLGKPE